jgi:hypothetical protein
MRTIQLYGTGAATATSVAQVTMPSAGRIVGVQVMLVITSITAGCLCRIELSKVPTNQAGVNGAIDPFLEVGLGGNFVSSGLAQAGVNQFFPVDINVRQGEIVYMHAAIGGTVTYQFTAIIHYS